MQLADQDVVLALRDADNSCLTGRAPVFDTDKDDPAVRVAKWAAP